MEHFKRILQSEDSEQVISLENKRLLGVLSLSCVEMCILGNTHTQKALSPGETYCLQQCVTAVLGTGTANYRKYFG